MNTNTLSALLNGSKYPLSIDKKIIEEAKQAGLVIVYGASDDLLEFSGAIDDELYAYGGRRALVDADGLLPDRESIDNDRDLEAFFKRKPNAKIIEAIWCNPERCAWMIETDIPHETFLTFCDGERFSCGIVFALSDV